MRIAIRALLFPAGLIAATAWADEAPLLKNEGAEVVAVNDSESSKFTASGGYTDPPPATLGTPPWVRTGRRQYLWNLVITEPVAGELEGTHPQDGTVTSTGVLYVPQDKAGSFSVSVSLQEEWEDSGNPRISLFWPLFKGSSLPQALQGTAPGAGPFSGSGLVPSPSPSGLEEIPAPLLLPSGLAPTHE
jgi:hypothetical protein